jgi:hypothetical protein
MRGWLVCVILLTVGCTSGSGGDGSGGADAGTCPNDLPASCPPGAPGYKARGAGILGTYCNGCHAPGGVDASRPLVTYAEVYAQRSAVLDQVYACRMPPDGGPMMSSQDRDDLLAWLVCGAPDD